MAAKGERLKVPAKPAGKCLYGRMVAFLAREGGRGSRVTKRSEQWFLEGVGEVAIQDGRIEHGFALQLRAPYREPRRVTVL